MKQDHGGAPKRSVAFWVALVLHMLLLWPYLLSGLLAPLYAVGFLMVVWAGLLVLLFRWRSERRKPLIAPVMAVVAWFAVLWLGDAFLGWTA